MRLYNHKLPFLLVLILGIAFLLHLPCSGLAQEVKGTKKPILGFRGANSSHSGMRDTVKAKEWIEETLRSWPALPERMQQCHWVEPQIQTEPGYERVSYRLRDFACLRFIDGGTVWVRCHSGHQNAEVGDITIAIDDRGGIYVNFSHICGGLIQFYHPDVKGRGKEVVSPPRTSFHFFQQYVCDIDDAGWQPWDRN